MQLFSFVSRLRLRSLTGILVSVSFAVFLSISISAQQPDPKPPVVVQPGAPGQPSKVLPASTTARLPPSSAKDVEFMQGMIMHHAQAVEMVALMDSRTENKD